MIAAHNAEEALTAPDWIQSRLPELQRRFGIVPLAAETERLYVGLILVTLAAGVLVALASRAVPRSVGALSLIVLYSIFFANAFVPHLAGSILLRSYTPGVVSAVFLVIPYCSWYFHKALADGMVTAGGLAGAVALGFILYVPALWMLLWASA